jgi:hypothetical protein
VKEMREMREMREMGEMGEMGSDLNTELGRVLYQGYYQ